MWNKLPIGKFFSVKAPLTAGYTGREYLDERYFGATIVVAMAIHLAGIYAWQLMPHTEVVDIPVRALSIKLGDGDPMTEEELRAAQPNSDNKNDVESAISQIVRDTEEANQQRTQSVINSMEKAITSGDKEVVSQAIDKALTLPSNEAAALVQESANKLSNIAKQFVRANSAESPTKHKPKKNSAKEAELMSRYEQLISLWIEKFKQYPLEARSAGMQGETVVRIRIDRKGNIRYYILERSTGHQLLDRAAIDMVRRANPVPAVPNDYPKGDLIEFLIPVNFHLQ
jgi:TonB family protein